MLEILMTASIFAYAVSVIALLAQGHIIVVVSVTALAAATLWTTLKVPDVLFGDGRGIGEFDGGKTILPARVVEETS